MSIFSLQTDHTPRGDQPEAIRALVSAFEATDTAPEALTEQVLLGVTGSGKTFTMAHVIAEMGRPSLVLAPNKTLAAQLYQEFRELFPENAVEYFVSYYDYYQPEAYVPVTDTFIEKDAMINDTIDRMRHAATQSLLTRRDVIIVASVSCIYGIGSAEAYYGLLVQLEKGQTVDRDTIIRKLVEIQYERNDYDLYRGMFRVRGDVLEIVPASQDVDAIRIEWFGDEIDRIASFDPLTGSVTTECDKVAIFPASHYVTFAEHRERAIQSIRLELGERLRALRDADKLLEAQRLEQRTMFDLEMMEQTGHCNGIENYSRHMTGRKEGDAPPTLLDYFPDDYLMFIDESHVTVPQVGAMWRGDRSRKETLVEHGFRLPSALDNRPLMFEEFVQRINQVTYVSATPGNYELERTGGQVVQQIVRPTGLLDPTVSVRPVKNQVDDLLFEIRQRVERKERVLVTTLTKRLAEHLTEYYHELGVRVRYMHSDIHTLERMEIIRGLRNAEFDVLVGINLLREGLDIPEVSLVAILDADKEGFLRSVRSLIQTIGRASRNVGGEVIMYADKITGSMRIALDETERRRVLQHERNRVEGITPTSIVKPVRDMGDRFAMASEDSSGLDVNDQAAVKVRCGELRDDMWQAAHDLDFERAARLRDELNRLEEAALGLQPGSAGSAAPQLRRPRKRKKSRR